MWSGNSPASSSASASSSSGSGGFHSTSRPSNSSRYTSRQSAQNRSSSSGGGSRQGPRDSSEPEGRSSGGGRPGASSSSSTSTSDEEWRTRFAELQRRLRERDTSWMTAFLDKRFLCVSGILHAFIEYYVLCVTSHSRAHLINFTFKSLPYYCMYIKWCNST